MTPRRLTARGGGLLVVDVQQKLIDLIADRGRLVFNIERLIEAARCLEMPVWATEQYPQGLGPTVPRLAAQLGAIREKRAFSCCAVAELVDEIRSKSIEHLTLAGIEAHVCIAQTALDLLAEGFVVQIAADAAASRADSDRKFALRRLERAGAIISTTEAVLFEWLETSAAPAFKQISALVRREGPAT